MLLCDCSALSVLRNNANNNSTNCKTSTAALAPSPPRHLGLALTCQTGPGASCSRTELDTEQRAPPGIAARIRAARHPEVVRWQSCVSGRYVEGSWACLLCGLNLWIEDLFSLKIHKGKIFFVYGQPNLASGHWACRIGSFRRFWSGEPLCSDTVLTQVTQTQLESTGASRLASLKPQVPTSQAKTDSHEPHSLLLAVHPFGQPASQRKGGLPHQPFSQTSDSYNIGIVKP